MIYIQFKIDCFTNASKDAVKQEHLYTVGENAN
jgi:hypothetical protein